MRFVRMGRERIKYLRIATSQIVSNSIHLDRYVSLRDPKPTTGQ